MSVRRDSEWVSNGLNEIQAYMPHGWLDAWRVVRAESASRLVKWVYYGDSIGEGYTNAGRDFTAGAGSGHAGRVNALLQAEYGDGGSGYVGVLETDFYSSGGASGTGRVGLTGTWTATNVGIAAARLKSVVAGSTLTFTVRGTTIVVWYGKLSGGGGMNVVIDGGAPDVLATSNATDTTESKSYSVGAGDHTVVITNNATGGCYVYGVEGRNATGVALYNMSHWGASSQWYALAAHAPYVFVIDASTFPWAADLFIDAMGGNDLVTSEVNYFIGKRYSDYYACVANPDALRLQVSDHIGAIDTGTFYHQLTGQQEKMAHAMGQAWVNFWSAGHGHFQWMIDQGYHAVGNVHPTTAGYAWQADILASLLLA